MKSSVFLLMLAMATAVAAQQGQAPQASVPPVTNIVAGGWGTPHEVRFMDREYVYLEGSGFSVGAQYSILRQERDPNRYETFRAQAGLLRQLGRAYSDIGRVRVVAVQNNMAITQVEFNCTDIMEGDAAVPFAERQTPELRAKINLRRQAGPGGHVPLQPAARPSPHQPG
jgi:hypothetical protein